MKRLTVRTLVRRQLGPTGRLTQQQIDDSIGLSANHGWRTAWTPAVADAERVITLIRHDHPVASLYAGVRNNAGVCLIEVLLDVVGELAGDSVPDLRKQAVRDVLTRYGLALAGRDSEHVQLLGSSPELAKFINYPRYGASKRGFLLRPLIAGVLGYGQQPKRVTEQMRLETALRLNAHMINAEDVLVADQYAHLVSAWLIDDEPEPCPVG